MRLTFLSLRLARTAAFSVCALAMLPAFADDAADVQQMLRSGRAAEALARTDRAIAARPKDPQMLFLRGVALGELGRSADAIAAFTHLTEQYPELPEPYNNLAVLHAAQGQYDKARASLEAAVRANPNYAVAYENLGDVYARLAAQAYARSSELDGSNAGVRGKLTLVREFLKPAQPAGTRARP